MATKQGKQRARPQRVKAVDDSPESDDSRGSNTLPDLARRALSIGLSGFFLTEETIRKALGDTLPKDWQDFAIEQSDRTRRDFVERLSFEIGQALQNADIARILTELLEGRTLEVKAEIRLAEKGPVKIAQQVEVSAKDETGES